MVSQDTGDRDRATEDDQDGRYKGYGLQKCDRETG